MTVALRYDEQSAEPDMAVNALAIPLLTPRCLRYTLAGIPTGNGPEAVVSSTCF